jgi:hypothetical protein
MVMEMEHKVTGGTTTDADSLVCMLHDNVSWSNTNTVFCCCGGGKKQRGVVNYAHGPCKIYYIVIYMCLSEVTYSCMCTYLYTPN